MFGGIILDVDMSQQNSVTISNPALTQLVISSIPNSEWEWNYTPHLNYFGDDALTYKSFDSELYSEQSRVLFDINRVNDPPTIEDIDDKEINEDTQLILTLNIEDLDGDELTVMASSDNSALDIEIIQNILRVTPMQDWFGFGTITLTVSDDFLTDSTAFGLTVNPTNDLPTID